MHQVRELEYFLFSELEGRPGYLSYGGIKTNVKTFQFASRHSDDPLYLLFSEVRLVELHHLDVGDAPSEDVGVHHVEVVVAEVDLLQLRVSTHLTASNESFSLGFLSFRSENKIFRSE